MSKMNENVMKEMEKSTPAFYLNVEEVYSGAERLA